MCFLNQKDIAMFTGIYDYLQVDGSVAHENLPQLQLTLLSEAMKADKSATKLWARQRRLSLKLLQDYWNAVEDDDAIMLDKDFRFNEWSENGHHFSGLFDRDSREIHGVVREVDKLG